MGGYVLRKMLYWAVQIVYFFHLNSNMSRALQTFGLAYRSKQIVVGKGEVFCAEQYRHVVHLDTTFHKIKIMVDLNP